MIYNKRYVAEPEDANKYSLQRARQGEKSYIGSLSAEITIRSTVFGLSSWFSYLILSHLYTTQHPTEEVCDGGYWTNVGFSDGTGVYDSGDAFGNAPYFDTLPYDIGHRILGYTNAPELSGTGIYSPFLGERFVPECHIPPAPPMNYWQLGGGVLLGLLALFITISIARCSLFLYRAVRTRFASLDDIMSISMKDRRWKAIRWVIETKERPEHWNLFLDALTEHTSLGKRIDVILPQYFKDTVDIKKALDMEHQEPEVKVRLRQQLDDIAATQMQPVIDLLDEELENRRIEAEKVQYELNQRQEVAGIFAQEALDNTAHLVS